MTSPVEAGLKYASLSSGNAVNHDGTSKSTTYKGRKAEDEDNVVDDDFGTIDYVVHGEN